MKKNSIQIQSWSRGNAVREERRHFNTCAVMIQKQQRGKKAREKAIEIKERSKCSKATHDSDSDSDSEADAAVEPSSSTGADMNMNMNMEHEHERGGTD